MHEMGIESSILQDIVSGQKTIEARLGKPKFLKVRAGDIIQLREDIWDNGKIISSTPNAAAIKIDQVLYFESFDEMLRSLNYKLVLPRATSVENAIGQYRKFYSPEEEYEHGVVAILFSLV